MYDDMTLIELNAEIALLRNEIRSVHSGRAVERVGGEGRMMAFTKANAGGLQTLLRSALAARGRLLGHRGGSALTVEIRS